MVKMLKKIVKGVLLGVGTLCVGMLCLGACVSKSNNEKNTDATVVENNTDRVAVLNKLFKDESSKYEIFIDKDSNYLAELLDSIGLENYRKTTNREDFEAPLGIVVYVDYPCLKMPKEKALQIEIKNIIAKINKNIDTSDIYSYTIYINSDDFTDNYGNTKEIELYGFTIKNEEVQKCNLESITPKDFCSHGEVISKYNGVK